LPDGSALADHQASALRQFEQFGLKPKLKAAPPEDRPQCPPELFYLWRWFLELVAGIQPNGWSPPIVSWVDLHAWHVETGIDLSRWEALTLIRLGQLRASIIADQSKDKP